MAEERAELERIAPAEEAPLAHPRYPRNVGFPEAAGYGYGYGAGNEESEGINMREIWRMIQKRKWLIIAITLVVTTLVTIEAYRTKSTYRASAFIELGKETPAVRSGPHDTVIQTEDSDVYFPQLAINTHLFRITSEPLLEDVVVHLKLHENPAFVDLGKKSVWEALETIQYKFMPPQNEPVPEEVKEASPEEPKYGTRSREESERLSPYVGVIAGGLRADQVKDTRTLRVTYTHTNPNIAAAVANGVAEAFIDRSFESKTERYTRASQWLDSTTRELKARVERAEQALADYSRTHNIFSTDGKETLTTEKLARLHELATRAETERMLKQSLYEEVKAGRVSQLPAAFADLKLAALQSKLEEAEAHAAKLALKFGPENPAIIEAQQQIAILKGQIETGRRALEEKFKSEYQVAVRDEASLKAALAQAKGEAVQQNQDAIGYNILKQEVETAKSLYTDFLNKTNQARVEVAQQHNTMQLVQPARVPGAPEGPARFRMIMFALLLSLGGGVGLAYALEYLDNTIKTVEDVGRYMRLPALGVIPAMAATPQGKLGNGKKAKKALSTSVAVEAAARQGYDTDRLMVMDTRSTAAEAYRVVRTSMLLSTAGNPPRTVLVTSGQPGEGKTTTVVNTALSLAQLGASVLVIDCDLRKPSTHKVFGLENTRGLSTYLSRDIPIDDLIQKLPVANISLLPCGPIPPNPAELISSERMKSLLRLLCEKYDHVLIDSPPLINVTDPVILSTMVDGVILVVQGGKSTRAVAQRARQDLSSVGAKIFGVVLNNVDIRRGGYNDYYYYRYYSDYSQKSDKEA